MFKTSYVYLMIGKSHSEPDDDLFDRNTLGFTAAHATECRLEIKTIGHGIKKKRPQHPVQLEVWMDTLARRPEWRAVWISPFKKARSTFVSDVQPYAWSTLGQSTDSNR